MKKSEQLSLAGQSRKEKEEEQEKKEKEEEYIRNNNNSIWFLTNDILCK
jgi:hypothetical protein